MSTKQTIKFFDDPPHTNGYHLYDDALSDDGPVSLELRGVYFAASPGCVTVEIPRAWAIELGLI